MLGHSFKKSSYEQKIEHASTKTTDKTARSNIYLFSARVWDTGISRNISVASN